MIGDQKVLRHVLETALMVMKNPLMVVFRNSASSPVRMTVLSSPSEGVGLGLPQALGIQPLNRKTAELRPPPQWDQKWVSKTPRSQKGRASSQKD